MEESIENNIELRSEILTASLYLEKAINDLIILCLSIENKKKKAISNKNSSLSFKNRIDLLFDLDIIDVGEHQRFLLVMEFRNQFLHNLECNSFSKAIELLGNDKGNKLLKFGNIARRENLEYQYKAAFVNLKMDCLKIILSKIEDREKQLNDRVQMHINFNETQIFWINKYFNIIKTIYEIIEVSALEIPEVIKLSEHVDKAIKNDVNSLQTSKEYLKLQAENKNIYSPEKLNLLLKK